jgi:hypothetical protein
LGHFLYESFLYGAIISEPFLYGAIIVWSHFC